MYIGSQKTASEYTDMLSADLACADTLCFVVYVSAVNQAVATLANQTQRLTPLESSTPSSSVFL
ncbi:hypothetical protein BOTBODRAFT_57650 [Botryobasidium botryosum FD-172 SS1]|uniref:Uncharacterized protein n=1 Tax=Botryobasidium botryosum (strain FD-172 SS1) TaxID=930990 RepID=A0A067M5Q8_BOTB1|nr:hypothetical protein BOTBODRAFT_57650 [Botryobasidium botryosum FD-172 SS1]